ncbi:Y-family DNA polymerase [Rickettsia hoogstraalii]
MNSYFATIEQQLDHTLRGKPIAIVANLTDSTSAIAVSYEAKKLGINTGTKIFEAACRLTGELCNQDNAINIATRIKQSIRDNVDECIECSIGIAPN